MISRFEALKLVVVIGLNEIADEFEIFANDFDVDYDFVGFVVVSIEKKGNTELDETRVSPEF